MAKRYLLAATCVAAFVKGAAAAERGAETIGVRPAPREPRLRRFNAAGRRIAA